MQKSYKSKILVLEKTLKFEMYTSVASGQPFFINSDLLIATTFLRYYYSSNSMTDYIRRKLGELCHLKKVGAIKISEFKKKSSPLVNLIYTTRIENVI